MDETTPEHLVTPVSIPDEIRFLVEYWQVGHDTSLPMVRQIEEMVTVLDQVLTLDQPTGYLPDPDAIRRQVAELQAKAADAIKTTIDDTNAWLDEHAGVIQLMIDGVKHDLKRVGLDDEGEIQPVISEQASRDFDAVIIPDEEAADD